MRLLSIIIVAFLCMPNANAASHFFVVDGSGSMSGVRLLKAKNAMHKLGVKLFSQGDRVSVVVASDSCSATPRLVMPFVNDSKGLDRSLNAITLAGGDGIAVGFEYAQKKMKSEGLNGHIYMFGDGNGIGLCKGIENIANEQKAKGALTPFSYVGLDWSGEEKQQWRGVLADNKMQLFDYNEIANYSAQNHEYFKKFSYINQDGSSNDGKNYPDQPWQCIQSDGLFWYSQNKDEQHKRFYIKEPRFKKLAGKCGDECLVSDYVDQLNTKQICGRTDWRLSDYYELRGLTQLREARRDMMFPYTLVWPHISAKGGDYEGFRKGINPANGGTFDYRENRPYAAMFVAGGIDKSLFDVPDAMVEKYPAFVSVAKPKPIPKAKPKLHPKPKPQPSTISLEALLKQFDQMQKGHPTKGDLMSLARKLHEHPESNRLRGDEQARILYTRAANRKYKSVDAMYKLAHYYDPRYLSPQDKADLVKQYSGTKTSWRSEYADLVVRWYKKAIRYHDTHAKNEFDGLKAWAQTDRSEVASLVLDAIRRGLR